MGEFAGYALDETVDAENDRWLYCRGWMRDEVAFDLGIIDHMGRYEHVPMFSTRRKLRCRHCGSTDVRWRQQGGKWVLFSTQSGVEHRCPVSDDAFPDLTK